MIRMVRAGTPEQKALFDDMRTRAAQTAAQVREAVSGILEDVRARGWEAVKEYSLRFDGAEPREIPLSRCEAACGEIDPEVLDALRRAARNIADYQRRLLPQGGEWLNPDGVRVGVLTRGLDRVGVYVPGGTAAYPSSVLMNVIPAKAAGVREVVMVTPPTKHLSPEVLAAAHIAGVDRLFALGGAQACAALAFGAGDVPRADKLVGPGNVYVTEAKRQLFGQIDIDSTAGPSEVLVIADAHADPRYAAADLLSQAEHDALASAVLLTDSEELAQAVAEELSRQLTELPRAEVARKSLEAFGAAVVCDDLAQCCALSDELAPEHLEILTENPRDLLPLLRNAGAIFLGAYAPEPLGDYLAGPSHVLPTSGTARFFSPLSAEDFIKRTSLIECDAPALRAIGEKIEKLAVAEGLHAHAGAVRIRGAL